VYRSVAALGLFARFYTEARIEWESLFPQLVAANPRPPPLDHMNYSREDLTGLHPLQMFEVGIHGRL
jgi:hypothetical protein